MQYGVDTGAMHCGGMMNMKQFTYMTKRVVLLVMVVFMVAALCTGCSSERKEEQLTYREKGIAFMEQGKYEEALESFQSALDLSLGNVGETEMDICFYKAEAQYMLGNTEEALNTYSAIIAYNEDAKAYFLRGNLYYSLEEEEKALKDYAAAIENEKKDYDLYMGVYEALIAHGKEQEAQAYLNQALELKGNTAYDKMQKGRVNYLLGETQTAISLLEEAVKDKEMSAYYYLAEIQYALGEDETAAANMAAYMESGEADSYNLFNIANNQLGKGNADMAIECLNAALNLEKVPNRQIIMKTLVIAYEQKLDFASAKKIMADYVKDYPDDEEALREYTFLETR